MASHEAADDVIEKVDEMIDLISKFRSSVHTIFTELNPHNRTLVSHQVSVPNVIKEENSDAPHSDHTPYRTHITSCFQQASSYLAKLKDYQKTNLASSKYTNLKTILNGNVDRQGVDKLKSKVDSTLQTLSKEIEKKRYVREDPGDLELFETPRKERMKTSPNSVIHKISKKDESSYKDPQDLLSELKDKSGKFHGYFSIVDLLSIHKEDSHCSIYLRVTDIMIVNILFRDNMTPYEANAFSIHENVYETSISEHKIFRQVSKTFCQALDFYTTHPVYKFIPFQAFMIYLCLYRKLFMDKCSHKNCNCIMSPPHIMDLPYFRDFETGIAYHIQHIPVNRRVDLNLPFTSEYKQKEIKKNTETPSMNTPMSTSNQTPQVNEL